MLASLPAWAKFLFSFAASAFLGLLFLDRFAVHFYFVVGIALAVGGFLFWKNERAAAWGVFTAVAFAGAMLLLAIRALGHAWH